MSDLRVKPCANCRHPKTSHRVGYCTHQWVTLGQTFMGVGTVVKDCQCDGYQPKDAER